MYKRILLKLSGEQLQGESNQGFSIHQAEWLAGQIKPLVVNGTEVVIMVGGGNYIRGAQIEDPAIPRVVGDSAGMLATMINGLLLNSVFENSGLPVRVLSNISAEQLVDQFTHRRALSHLKKGRIVIVAGGTGKPYFTTDTAAASLALELQCDAVLKATKVDGIYSDDPEKNPNAYRLDYVSYDQALSDKNIKVMDKAAIGLAMEHHLPVVIFKLLEDGNIERASRGDDIGTVVKD